jgi:hypothetical protein
MSNRGVFVIARKLLDQDDPYFGGEPFSRREAWQWLIAEAAWKPRRVQVKERRSISFVDLERGQLSYSRSYLRKAWGWSSDKKVRTFMDRLEMDSRIGRQTGQQNSNHQIVITICNYDEYQFPVNEQTEREGQQKGQPKGQQRASKGPETYKDNKRKKELLLSASESNFVEWYSIYPRKKQRNDALRAYRKLIDTGNVNHADLLKATRAFAAQEAKRPVEERRFIPYPASWLNAGGYADEPDNPVAPPIVPERDPRTFTAAEWQQRVQHFRTRGEWAPDLWGPKPGSPDCLVPADLLGSESSGSSGMPSLFGNVHQLRVVA